MTTELTRANEARATGSAQVVMAASIGALYGWLVVNFWDGYAANSPVNDWLLDALAKPGYETSYLVAIYVHDAIVNVLLAVPVAAVLVAFRALNNWVSLLIAVVTGIVASYYDIKWGPRLLSTWGFWLGLGMSGLSLPIAFAGIRALRRGSENVA